MTFSEIIGAIGVTILLGAYLMNVLKWTSPDKWLYCFLNFLGAALAGYSSWLIEFVPFVILESVWALVSLISLIKALKK